MTSNNNNKRLNLFAVINTSDNEVSSTFNINKIQPRDRYHLPINDEPVHSEPVHSEPVQNEPFNSENVLSEDDAFPPLFKEVTKKPDERKKTNPWKSKVNKENLQKPETERKKVKEEISSEAKAADNLRIFSHKNNIKLLKKKFLENKALRNKELVYIIDKVINIKISYELDKVDFESLEILSSITEHDVFNQISYMEILDLYKICGDKAPDWMVPGLFSKSNLSDTSSSQSSTSLSDSSSSSPTNSSSQKKNPTKSDDWTEYKSQNKKKNPSDKKKNPSDTESTTTCSATGKECCQFIGSKKHMIWNFKECKCKKPKPCFFFVMNKLNPGKYSKCSYDEKCKYVHGDVCHSRNGCNGQFCNWTGGDECKYVSM